MSPLPQEAIGAQPQSQVMQNQANGLKGISKQEIDNLRKDPQIIQAVRLATGRDFPMERLDDVLVVNIAALIHKLGVQGAVAWFKKNAPPDMQAQIRGLAMKQGTPTVQSPIGGSQ